MLISRKLASFLTATSIAATTVAMAGAPAHANPSAAPAASNVSVAMQSMIELYPGSQVVSEDTLRIAPGIEISMPADQPRDQRVLSKQEVAAELAAYRPARPAPAAPPQGSTKRLGERASVAAGSTLWDCAYQYLCLYQNASFGGYKIRFLQCGFMDLGTISFPTGGKWNDKVTSYINNQTTNTTSIFYNWNGVERSWDYLFSSSATNYDYNIGTSRGYNDIIDGVHVC